MLSTRHSCQILMKLEFSWQIFEKKKPSNLKFRKIRPVGAESFHADGQTDRYDEANSSFLGLKIFW
jgi:hypothetical protein